MKAFRVLYVKELKGLLRSYKWVWVPLVFVLLGAMQPITAYYLPQILTAAGSLPEGAVIEIPPQSPAQVLAATLQQYSTLGVLIVALSFMSMISGERTSGVAGMLLVKPVPYSAYVLSKWAAMVTLTTVSFSAGYGAALYYTILLIGAVEGAAFGLSLFVYLLWLLLVGTFALTASALVDSSGAAAFAALGMSALLAVTAAVFPERLAFSPGRLPALAGELMLTGAWPKQSGFVLLFTSLIMLVALIASTLAVRRRPALDG